MRPAPGAARRPWGVLFSTMSYLAASEEASWLQAAERGADWWIAHAPSDHVAFWDFDDPAIPNTERDTAATAVAVSALLKLSRATKDATSRAKYRAAAEATIKALVTSYLTPTSPEDKRIPGILTESCFNKRPDARPQDAANKCEFIVADYYLLECCWCWPTALCPYGRRTPAGSPTGRLRRQAFTARRGKTSNTFPSRPKSHDHRRRFRDARWPARIPAT